MKIQFPAVQDTPPFELLKTEEDQKISEFFNKFYLRN